MGLRYLFTGSRFGFNFFRIYYEIDILNHRIGIDEIIVGDAKGVDTTVKTIAELLGIKCRVFKADWKSYGNAAGPIRNSLMLNQKIDYVIAFHKDIWTSKGTLNCISQARKLGIPVKLIENENDYTGVQFIENR